MFPPLREQFVKDPFLIQNDLTRSINTYTTGFGVEELDGPLQSPELHSIGHLWDSLREPGHIIQNQCLGSQMDYWKQIPINVLVNPVESLPS